jgi:hypothetical protein
MLFWSMTKCRSSADENVLLVFVRRQGDAKISNDRPGSLEDRRLWQH